MGKEDLDGVEKNISHFKEEIKAAKPALRVHWNRLRSNFFDTHAYVNLLVEANRLMPYTLGHVYAVLLPILVVSIIILAIS